MRKINVLILSLFSFFLILSCKKKSDTKIEELTINKTELDFPDENKLDSFIVTSTLNWKIIKPQNTGWVWFSKDSGIAGKTVVRVRVSVNTSETAKSADFSISDLTNTVTPVTLKVTVAHSVTINRIENPYAKGGEIINIIGKGFSPIPANNKVTINGAEVSVQSAQNTLLKVTVPLRSGSGPLIVKVNNKADTADFIYKWVGLVTILAGNDNGYLDGIGTSAKFYHPQGLAFDANDNLYVCDYANYKIRKITPDALVTTLPGRIPPILFPNAPPTDYNLPTGIAVKSDGTVFVVEYNAEAITKISPSGVVSIVAGNNSQGFQNGHGSIASFYRPTDIAIDASGNLYVTDRDNLCIRKINTDNIVSTFAGGQWGYLDGADLLARFNRPTSVAIDNLGNLFTTDHFNHRIRKVDKNRFVTTVAGTGSNGSDDGPALTKATFMNPIEIAIAMDGTLYVGENDGDNHIRIIRPNGVVESITTFINTASGQPYQFSGIYGLAVSKGGVLHVADYYNSRICKVSYE